MSIDSDIAAIKKRLADAQLVKARSEGIKQSVEQQYQEALQALQEQFGLDNLQDARAKLTELEKAVQDELASITSFLDEYDL